MLNWLCLLSISLLSITIPTYAISVAFLGRETRRSLWDRERRDEDLRKKLDALAMSYEFSMAALNREIEEGMNDIVRLTKRSEQLSVKAAFVYPFVSFCVAFALGVFGVAVNQLAIGGEYLAVATGVVSTLLILYGSYRLYCSLRATNEAALAPEAHVGLRVSFLSGSTVWTFPHSKQREVLITIHNYGREMAESVLVLLHFPSGFELSDLSGPSTYLEAASGRTFSQPVLSRFVGLTWGAEIKELHADIFKNFSLGNVSMPTRPGKYDVPVEVWEKRLGRSESVLTFYVNTFETPSPPNPPWLWRQSP